MVTREDLDHFHDPLSADGVSYTEIDENLWVVRPSGELGFDVVVNYSPPVVLLRLTVMNVPSDENRSAVLSRRLLELNASDLIHGSYGIEGDAIVLTEALELSHLDFEEFLASYESMTLALASHLREFSTYRDSSNTGETRAVSHREGR